jgi:endonuclease G
VGAADFEPYSILARNYLSAAPTALKTRRSILLHAARKREMAMVAIDTTRITELAKNTAPERARVRRLVAQGRWREAEPDLTRLKRFTDRKIAKIAPAGAEAIIGDTVDFQAASFLTEGAQIRRAVAYVEVNGPTSSELGSGFLISPNLFMTNNHVIVDANAARGTQITFDRESDENGRPRATTSFLLDPEAFGLFSPPDKLDYALIAVGQRNSGNAALSDLGFCILSNRPDKHAIGMNCNIIQHPRGWPKMISVRNNILTYRTDQTLLYETDTEQGASGAPVFNDDWDLVALHHWGAPYIQTQDEQGQAFPAHINEGVRISAIYADLQARLQTLGASQRELLEEALSYAEKPIVVSSSERRLTPPHPAAAEALVSPSTKGPAMALNDDKVLRVTIPIEVTVRVGASGLDATPVVAAEQLAPNRLLRGAEALKLDKDYSNRNGYDPDFIDGLNLPLPKPTGSLRKQIATLRAEEPNAELGILAYEHFSAVMNKAKRIAIFTATNIDGDTYLNVDRKTGLVQAEGETWYKDPRISASFFLDQTFYSGWSDYFDRGHLTRRSDPTWGSAEEAERANADTFHFTNCSPQHFRFNETTRYWQGAERYVLENGLLAEESRKRICVFQGPIFDDKIDLWSDDVQIPSSFFKIIVWQGKDSVKAVGLVVDQLSLLSETRKALKPPAEAASINVSQWRAPISEIEKRTQLDFGQTIRDADTIGAANQPQVGAEAVRLIRSFGDLLA